MYMHICSDTQVHIKISEENISNSEVSVNIINLFGFYMNNFLFGFYIREKIFILAILLSM